MVLLQVKVFLLLVQLVVALLFCDPMAALEGEEQQSRVLNKYQTDGQWSSWGDWLCDAVCGRGRHFRKRHCIAMGDFGIPVCEGKGIEKNTTECQVPCPGIKQIRDRILGPSLTRDESAEHETILNTGGGEHINYAGESVRFNCSSNLSSHLLENYTKSILYWEKNGDKLYYNISRMRLSHQSVIEIKDLQVSDTGVYTCVLRFHRALSITMSVFSLIVIDESVVIKAVLNEDLPVTCNSDVIGKVFPSLEAEWILNDTGHILKNYGIEPVVKINSDKIENVQDSFSGLWICVIRDGILNRKWATNAFIVKVGSRDGFWLWYRFSSVLGVHRFMVVAAGFVVVKLVILLIIKLINIMKRKKLLKELEAVLEIAERISAEENRKSQDEDGDEIVVFRRSDFLGSPKGMVDAQPKNTMDRVTEDIFIKRKDDVVKFNGDTTKPHLVAAVDPIVDEIRLRPNSLRSDQTRTVEETPKVLLNTISNEVQSPRTFDWSARPGASRRSSAVIRQSRGADKYPSPDRVQYIANILDGTPSGQQVFSDTRAESGIKPNLSAEAQPDDHSSDLSQWKGHPDGASIYDGSRRRIHHRIVQTRNLIPEEIRK